MQSSDVMNKFHLIAAVVSLFGAAGSYASEPSQPGDLSCAFGKISAASARCNFFYTEELTAAVSGGAEFHRINMNAVAELMKRLAYYDSMLMQGCAEDVELDETGVSIVARMQEKYLQQRLSACESGQKTFNYKNRVFSTKTGMVI